MNKTKTKNIISLKFDGEIEVLPEKDEESIVLTTIDSEGKVINKL